MEKKMYVSPEVEIVEIMEQGSLLAGSGENMGGENGWDDEPE